MPKMTDLLNSRLNPTATLVTDSTAEALEDWLIHFRPPEVVEALSELDRAVIEAADAETAADDALALYDGSYSSEQELRAIQAGKAAKRRVAVRVRRLAKEAERGPTDD
jgi:hypothetical protein